MITIKYKKRIYWALWVGVVLSTMVSVSKAILAISVAPNGSSSVLFWLVATFANICNICIVMFKLFSLYYNVAYLKKYFKLYPDWTHRREFRGWLNDNQSIVTACLKHKKQKASGKDIMCADHQELRHAAGSARYFGFNTRA
jgi:hypothetical protein